MSITLVALIAVTLLIEIRPQWSGFQRAYQTELRAKNGSKINKPGIRQDWLPHLRRTDRCITCHLGIEDTSFKDAPQPLRTHPAIPHHDFRKFGCTVCHEGQGLATTTHAAHGHEKNWEHPLLPGNVVEGSCGRCHTGGTVKGAPLLNAGRQLIDKYACIGCHKLPTFTRPDYIAVELGQIAKKAKPSWLIAWLQDSREYLPKTIMPDYKLTADQATDIASYLFNQSKNKTDSTVSPVPVTGTEEQVAEGKLIFSQSRCITCHALDGKGGSIGPDLGRIGDKIIPEWLAVWLGNPKDYFSKTRMPRFNFSLIEIESLQQYLMTELSNGDYTTAVNHPFGSSESAERGKKHVLKLGCTGCHVIPGITDSGRELAPSLEAIGSKTTSQFAFGQTSIEKTAANWMFVKTLRPRIFGQELVMPDYKLSPDETQAITVALVGQTRRDIPFSMIKPATAPVMRDMAGPFAAVADKYKCFVCHSIDGAGGTLAPDLTIEGSMVQRDWLTRYMADPDVIRPFLAERMPKLNLSQTESQTVADYLFSAARHDSIPTPTEWKNTGNVRQGKNLYFSKYNCKSCHTIGKDGGYYGPPLDNVGGRLTPAWIFRRLMNAHRFQPDSREPMLVNNQKDALDLTEFLMHLRKKGIANK